MRVYCINIIINDHKLLKYKTQLSLLVVKYAFDYLNIKIFDG